MNRWKFGFNSLLCMSIFKGSSNTSSLGKEGSERQSPKVAQSCHSWELPRNWGKSGTWEGHNGTDTFHHPYLHCFSPKELAHTLPSQCFLFTPVGCWMPLSTARLQEQHELWRNPVAWQDSAWSKNNHQDAYLQEN